MNEELKDKYLPEGILQERYDNFIPYYLKSGKQLIADLKEAFEPFENEMVVLEWPVCHKGAKTRRKIETRMN